MTDVIWEQMLLRQSDHAVHAGQSIHAFATHADLAVLALLGELTAGVTTVGAVTAVYCQAITLQTGT